MSSLEIRDPRLAAVVGADVTFEKIAGGCLFTSATRAPRASSRENASIRQQYVAL